MGRRNNQIYVGHLVADKGVLNNVLLRMHGGIVESIEQIDPENLPPDTLDFKNCTAYPGLINLHEHLACPVFHDPQAETLHPSSHKWILERYGKLAFSALDSLIPVVLASKYLLPNFLRLGPNSDLTNLLRLKPWPGFQTENLYHYHAFRNLFSGVTTVLDHSQYLPELPVRLVENKYTMYGMRWQAGQVKQLLKWKKNGKPLFIHVGDGVGKQTADDFDNLRDMGGLRPDVILVHGLIVTGKRLREAIKAGTRIIWCPTTSSRMFGSIVNVKAMLEQGLELSLATDAIDTGSFSMLDELRSAREKYMQRFHEDLGAEKLFEMVTSIPAGWLLEEKPLGKLEKGYAADLFLLENDGKDPHESLLRADESDIQAVFCNGELCLHKEDALNIDLSEYGNFVSIQKGGFNWILREKVPGSIERAEKAWEKLGLPSLWIRI